MLFQLQVPQEGRENKILALLLFKKFYYIAFKCNIFIYAAWHLLGFQNLRCQSFVQCCKIVSCCLFLHLLELSRFDLRVFPMSFITYNPSLCFYLDNYFRFILWFPNALSVANLIFNLSIEHFILFFSSSYCFF